jgi:hypothetical protein
MESPPPLSGAGVDVPGEMELIVFDALSKTPEHRPTAKSLGTRLHEFLQHA